VGRREPTHVREALRAAVAPVAPATLLAAVQTAWAGAVGESIAAEATPASERDGVVTVACSSATWANELDLLGDQILARLRAELPSDAPLEGLRFTLRRDSG
jgi:predicted nucleic acid-binding Zn ribbon protein